LPPPIASSNTWLWFLVLQKLRWLKYGPAAAGGIEVVHGERDDTVGVLVREGSDQDILDHAEHGSGGADPERQRENRQQGEPRSRPQTAKAVAQVLPQKKHVYWTAAGREMFVVYVGKNDTAPSRARIEDS